MEVVTMASPRRPKPVQQPWERAGTLLLAYLKHYARHEPFCRALETLYGTHCAAAPFETTLAETPELWRLRGTPHADAYRAALRDVAERFGLDRLRPSDGITGSGGEQLIHDWCRWRALEGFRDGGRTVPPEEFALMASASGGRPDIGEVVSVEQWQARSPSGETVAVVDERRAPIVRVLVESEWDPRTERQSGAEYRLLNEAKKVIRAELDRIAQDAQARRYVFADTANEEPEYVRWLFERAALGLRYQDIAPTEHASTVSKRVSEYAGKLGIDLHTKRVRPRQRRASAQS
jgi:hypothetical protein